MAKKQFSVLDQVAYVPQHVRNRDSIEDHPGIEYGFVTSIDDDGFVYCRFWRPDEIGYLRTVSNSERCAPDLLIHQISTTPRQIKDTWEAINE